MVTNGHFTATLTKEEMRRFRRASQLEKFDAELCVQLIRSDWAEAMQLLDLLPNSTDLLVRTLSDEALTTVLAGDIDLKPEVFLAAQAEKAYRGMAWKPL